MEHRTPWPRRRGLSLVELLFVVAIAAALTAIVLVVAGKIYGVIHGWQ